MEGKRDNAKNEDVEDDTVGTMDMAKSKRKPSKPAKKKLVAVKPPQPAGAEFDWPKKNYFEVTCVAAESSGSGQRMKNLIHRMVYIGKLKNDVEDRTEVGNYYERLLKNLQNNYVTEPITGMLLVYLKHLVHVVEASSDMFLEIMRDIEKEQKDSNCFLEQAKILVISHDISSRLYQQWNFRTLDIQAARMESYETSEADKVIIDILSQLLKLGNKLAITPKISLKQTLDSLHDKYPDLLPQQAHLNYLMEENDDSMIMPDEYIAMYEKPFDVTLESEMVWPLATKLFPYS